ncbi:MAG: hypothetical protein COT14_01695 [Candidatus Diapherotrites archaeon CG08_land_8_20_14_0_20_30_16]|nr:MAG: hypothetical protein COT14_01695 [Candidatus Diapherotrites archaeon CG08_land_8_20_14_0_20_30_16]
MSVRRAKKLKKRLGAGRTRGAGNTENRRGAGSKGGKGLTGKFGHKKQLFFHLIGTKIKNKPVTFINSITFNEINEYIYKQLKTKKLAEPVLLDFSEDKFLQKYNKIVSKGKLNYKVSVKNVALTERAKKEIVSKGGLIE